MSVKTTVRLTTGADSDERMSSRNNSTVTCSGISWQPEWAISKLVRVRLSCITKHLSTAQRGAILRRPSKASQHACRNGKTHSYPTNNYAGSIVSVDELCVPQESLSQYAYLAGGVTDIFCER